MVNNYQISVPVEMVGFQLMLLTAPLSMLTLQWKQRGHFNAIFLMDDLVVLT